MTMDFLSRFAGRRILITGTTGFKGSWLASWLSSVGADVAGLALPAADDAPLFQQLRLTERIRQHYGDIRDKQAVDAAFAAERPEIVIHMAAQALVRRSYADPKETFDTNVAGSVNVLEAIRNTDSVTTLVFVTSDKCYRNKEWAWAYRENDELGGPDPYSASKAAAELVFASYQQSYFLPQGRVHAAAVRAGNVIGGGDFSRDRIIPDCIRSLAAGEPIVLRYPASTRPWQHVLEPLSGYLTVAAMLGQRPDIARGAWNFGPDAENVRTVEELARHVVSCWGAGNVDSRPLQDGLHEAGLLMIDATKAKMQLGWRPRWDFATAINMTVSWYKQVSAGVDPIDVTSRQIATYLDRGAA